MDLGIHLVYLYSTDTRRAKVHRGVSVCERERERERETLLGNNVERREVVVVLEKMCKTVGT